MIVVLIGFLLTAGIVCADYNITKGTPFEFDNVQGRYNSLAQIDATHFLNTYSGADYDGWAVILTVDTSSGTITKGTPFEFDPVLGIDHSLAQIDATHFLNTYSGVDYDGWAVILTVDTSSGTITNGTPFEFNHVSGTYHSLAKIDATHFLNTYGAVDNKGWAVILTVDTSSGTITNGTPFEFDPVSGLDHSLAKIDATHFLNTYSGLNSDGWAVILTVDTSSGTITKGTPFEFDHVSGTYNSLAKIDATHFLNTYYGADADGWAVILTVDTGSGTITKGTPFEFDHVHGAYHSLAQIDATHFLNTYLGVDSDGWAVILTVDTSSGTITKGTPFEFDHVLGAYHSLAQIDATHFLNAYYGADEDGWAVILDLENEQTFPSYSNFTSTETTNLSEGDITNVTSLTLAIDNKGKIAFPSNHSINAENEDYDTNVKIEDSVIFVNSSALHSSFNSSATLTFESVDCNKPYVFYSETAGTFAAILRENQRCLAPLCTNITCVGSTLTVDVAHFTGYAAGTNANLTIEAEAGIKYPLDLIEFYAWYINSTDGTPISGECNISFDDAWGTWFEMDYNGSEYNYTKSLGFAAAGTHHYNITCSSANFVTLEANDTKVVSSVDIPEFSTITLGLGLIAVLGGLFIIRRKK